jgi:hypothetical protein
MVMASVFEDNERILDELENAEHRLEKIRIEGAGSADSNEKSALAAEIKTLVVRLAANIQSCDSDVEQLGGAVVLADLADVLERYAGVFEIDGLEERLEEIRSMIVEAGG